MNTPKLTYNATLRVYTDENGNTAGGCANCRDCVNYEQVKGYKKCR